MIKLKSRFHVFTLTATVLLGSSIICAAESCPRVEFGRFYEQPSSNTIRVDTYEGQILNFARVPIFRLSDISEAKLGENGGALQLKVKTDAAGRLKIATTGQSGARLALVVDNVAVMAIVWEGDFGLDDGNMQFSFQSEARARELFNRIERCVTK